MATKIQLRRGTAAHWASVDPILAEGEIGLELDTGKRKIGDGVQAWTALPYDLTQAVAEELFADKTSTEEALGGKVPTERTVAGKPLTDDVVLDKGDVGLGNVANLAPAALPISDATQDALDVRMFDIRALGAVGDGVTDDSIALQAAIDAAGPDTTVIWPRGHTFVTSRKLVAHAGQTWYGYGATIKRIDAITATTTDEVPGGSAPHTVPVDDASAFEVGMQVCLTDGTKLESTSHNIIAIEGNTITLDTTMATSFPPGSTLYTAFNLVSSPNKDKTTYLGLTLDGNRANNQVGKRWETGASMRVSGRQVVVRDCFFLDAQADALIADGDNTVLENNYIVDSEGNGIHVGISTHLRIVGNYVINANLGGDSVGHADGGIVASNDVHDAYIAGNYVENAKSGIGAWDSTDNSRLICTGNTFRDCTTAYAIDVFLPINTSCGQLTFTDNHFYDCGPVKFHSVNSGATDTTAPNRIIFANNYLENTKIEIGNAFDVVVSDNIQFFADTTSIAITIYQGGRIQVLNNLIKGGYRALYQSGATNLLLISTNTAYNQSSYGINIGDGSGIGARITNNTVASGPDSGASWFGIRASNGSDVSGNRVEGDAVAVGIYAPNGGEASNGAFIRNNVILLTSGYPISMGVGSQKNIVTGNIVNQSIRDLGSPNNTVQGNVTVL